MDGVFLGFAGKSELRKASPVRKYSRMDQIKFVGDSL